MGRRRSALVVALLLVVGAGALVVSRDGGAPPVARAGLPQPPDSDAPPGSPPHWIPSEEWVMQHWLPYDEERLLELLRIDRTTLWRHLRDDRRTIAGLAARRGWPDPERLAAALVQDRRGALSAGVLQSRALRTLTQGHLSQHILFHTLHQDAVPHRARETFGVGSTDELQRLRRLDIGPLQIARMNGHSRAHVERSARRALRERADAGVRGGALSRRQARLLLARQLRQLPRWLSEAHYNGPPRTDRTGRLRDRPVPAWAAPAVSSDGSTVVAEAYEPKLPLALQRGEISVVAWTAAGGAAGLSHGRRAHAGLPYSAYNPALSADGRRVVFETSAGNRNFAKRYGDTSITLLDFEDGRARPVGGAPDGMDRTAYAPALSGDGRVVAFQAVDAPRSDPGRSRPTRVLVRSVRGELSAVPRVPAYEPALSGDGRFVAFVSPSRDGELRVYVLDRATRRTALVSRATGRDGAPADGDSWNPGLSADGRYVAFASTARNLGGRPPQPGEARVLVRDLRRGTTRIASTGAGGAPLPGFASEPAISADGRMVAFSLAPRGALRSARRGRPAQRVHVRDLGEDAARPIGPPRGYAGQPAIAGDGSQVAFTADGGEESLRVLRAATSTGVASPLQLPSSVSPTGRRSDVALCRLAPPVW
jgi:Tol biopolymer transport system component